MAKQIISEEFKRMQKLAGIISESQLNENLSFDMDFAREIITINSPSGRIITNLDLDSKYRTKHYSPDNIIVFGDFIEETGLYNKTIEILKKYNIPYKLRKARLDNNVRIMMDITNFLSQEEKDEFNKNLTDTVNENETAEELFQMFKDEDLLDDRREYDVDDLMSAYPSLSKEEAKKLEKMLQNIQFNSIN
jgi:hypothetical protein